MYIFTKPSTRAGDTTSIYLRRLRGLNSEVLFPLTGYHTKVKAASLPYYLPIAGGKIMGFMPFPRLLVYVKCNQSRPGFELVSSIPFFTMITIIQR